MNKEYPIHYTFHGHCSFDAENPTLRSVDEGEYQDIVVKIHPEEGFKLDTRCKNTFFRHNIGVFIKGLPLQDYELSPSGYVEVDAENNQLIIHAKSADGRTAIANGHLAIGVDCVPVELN